MTASLPIEPRPSGRAGRRDPPSASAGRERPFVLCTLVSIALLFVVHAGAAGPAAIALAGASVALLLAALLSGRGELAHLGGLSSGMLAAWLPLGPLALAGSSLPSAIEATAVWPNVLVLLFAGRLLAQVAQGQFRAFWRSPGLRPARNGPQSFLAATLLGLALALTFYHFLGSASRDNALDPLAVTHRALAGDTIVHVAIVILFFVTLAAIADAALLLLDEKAFVSRLRRRLRSGDEPDRPTIITDALTTNASHLRAVHAIGTAHEAPDVQAGRHPLDDYHLAARRLIRQFLTFMPLLGFLGTVIGLAVAIGALGENRGAPGIDLAASLAGLSIQFETTLLGLLGGLLGQFALALLEKRETELWAECEHLVGVRSTGDAR